MSLRSGGRKRSPTRFGPGCTSSSPRAVLYLLADEASTLSAALAQMPTDVDLVEASDEHLDAAHTLWKEVHSLRDVGDTKTSKLLARKRPRLIPVQDSVTWSALGEPTR